MPRIPYIQIGEVEESIAQLDCCIGRHCSETGREVAPTVSL